MLFGLWACGPLDEYVHILICLDQIFSIHTNTLGATTSASVHDPSQYTESAGVVECGVLERFDVAEEGLFSALSEVVDGEVAFLCKHFAGPLLWAFASTWTMREKKTKKIGKRIREKEWRSMTICHCYRVPHQCEYMTSGPVYQKRRLRALAARSVKIVRFTGGWFNHKPVYCGDFLKTEP